MPRAQQLALATGAALWAATANAAGIRAHGDVSAAAPPARRLQSTLPDGLVTTDLGCYADSRSDRVLEVGLLGQSDMTPDVCAAYCLDAGSYAFYGLQYGQECWCGRSGTEYDRLGALEASDCAYPCTGDASSTCGGFDSFQAYEIETLDQPEGYLGCFVDSQTSRLFSGGFTTSASNTAETCKAACVGFAYYGLQYSSECFCGSADEDYTRLGESDGCGYRCAGDALSTCGGFNAMDVFAMDDVGTAPPATAPTTTEPPATPPTPITSGGTGYLGCFTDTSSRIFSAPVIVSDDNNSPETCMAACVGFAYYGVQYGKECFCGTADEDYTVNGESDNCVTPCTGDASLTCGGGWAMGVYAMDDDVVTPPPATAPPTTEPPATAPPTTAPPATAPPTTAPPATAPPTTAPPATAPPTTLPPSTAPPTTAPPATAPPTTLPPSTAPPTTAPPATAPPTTLSPSTAPPTTAPPVAVPTGDVLVDLVPCMFSSAAIGESTTPSLFVMSEFFKGYWSPKTEEFVVDDTDDLTALLVDSTDTTPHGKCNAVYIAYAPSAAQVAALTAYSAQFKVRLVYFPSALTHSTESFTTKLGIQTYFAGDITAPAFVQLSALGGEKVSITQPGFKTDPNLFATPLFSYPVIINTVPEAGIEVLAQYVDSDSEPYLSGDGGDQENAAVLSYTGADGHEELHVFNTIGWFDAGAWPWAHFYNEWATKGIFMGERRFYLGAVVDDLFLSTPEFEYDGVLNEAAVSQRCTGQDLTNLLSVQQALNTQYSGSDIITEFAFNGGGIAEHVSQAVEGITYVPEYEETMVTLKGTKWSEEGQINVHDTNWLAINVPLMQQDMADGTWEANDDLLAATISYLDTPSTFYHGHHTLIHLSRDQLRETDCVTEDTGNVQIALMTGMWDSDNYNWRSMVSPGITGLFNENCLDSAAQNLMVCYPGDNTFDGTVSGAAILVNEDNQFHSIYTSVSNNAGTIAGVGLHQDVRALLDSYDGAQIVPRFATFVYFNCVSGSCLVNENEYIRRFVCECTPLDPSIADYTCESTEAECIGTDGSTDIQSLGSIEAVFDTEAATTTRYMLTGRRDKYMFHQANIIPAGDVGDGSQSLLDYWYERVMEVFASYVTFPVKSIKFDDLCTEFTLHEALDDSSPYVTMALDTTGAVTGLTYVSGSGAGLVPLTVPTASAASIPTTGLSIQDTETYGTDTTYYLKDDDASSVSRVGSKPDASELAEVPPLVTESVAGDASATESPAEIVENAEELAENQEANALVPAENGGLLADEGLVDADVAADVAIDEAEEEGLL